MAIESKPIDKDHKTSYKSSKILKTTSSNGKPLDDIIVGVDSYATKYKELQKIGEGSYSIVMKSRNRATLIEVAVKKLKYRYRDKDQVEEIPEVKTLRRLPAHPNILQMLETHFDPNAGRVCLIFELMEMNLYELIKDRKKLLGENRVRGMIFQLMRGLRHLHKYGIFHRDVKPENILVQTKHGADALKLADLGSVRTTFGNPPYTEYISTRWYRSPECLLSRGRYTAKMDIWAAGCVLYEILTLRPLFPGSSEIDQITRIHNVLGVPSERVLEKLSHWARQDDGSYSSARQLKQSRFEAIKGVLNGLRNSTLVSNGNKKSPFSKILPSQISPAAQDLLKVMLHYDPDGRPSSLRVLQNEYFKELTKAADASGEPDLISESPERTKKRSELKGSKIPVLVSRNIRNNSNVTSISFSKNPTTISTTTGKKPSDIKLKEIRSRNQLKDVISVINAKSDESPKLSVKNFTNKNSSYFTVKIYKDESISSANSFLPKLQDEDTKLQLLVQARRRNSKNVPAVDQLKPTPSLNLYSKTQKPISLDIKNNNGNSSGYMTRFNLQQQRIHKADENCNYLNAPLQPKLSLKEETQSLLKKNERGMPEPTTLKIRGQNSNVATGRLLREADMRRRSEQIELENQLTNKSSKNKLLEKSNARVNYMPVNPFSKEGYYFSSDEDVVSLMRQKFDNLIIQRANDKKSKERQEQMKRMESDEEIKSFKSRLEKSRKLLRRSNDAELPMPVVEKKVTIPSTNSYFQSLKSYKDSFIDTSSRYHLQQPRKYSDSTILQNRNLEITPEVSNSQFHYSALRRPPLKQLSNTKRIEISYRGLKDEKQSPLKKDTKYFDAVAKMRHPFHCRRP